jgi:hypothetical protein
MSNSLQTFDSHLTTAEQKSLSVFSACTEPQAHVW